MIIFRSGFCPPESTAGTDHEIGTDGVAGIDDRNIADDRINAAEGLEIKAKACFLLQDQGEVGGGGDGEGATVGLQPGLPVEGEDGEGGEGSGAGGRGEIREGEIDEVAVVVGVGEGSSGGLSGDDACQLSAVVRGSERRSSC